MPRRSKGPYLILRKARRRNGKIIARAVFIIKDGERHIATGCFESEAEQASLKLAEYIAAKYQAPREERRLEQIDVADVLSIYVDDCVDRQSNAEKLLGRIARLNEFWGGKTLASVTTAECRKYAKWRGTRGGARRDLEDLRAAIGHHAKEGFHRAIVRVWLPDKGLPRDRWLTRSEAARLLWICWRYREIQTVHRGKRKGQRITTERSRRTLQHLARFILIGLYTGTRAGAIAGASPYRVEGRSYVDLDAGRFYRLAIGRRATNKRQPPAPLPPRLLAHMRRWHRRGLITTHFVEWNGRPVASVKTAFNRAVKLAGLEGKVTPHTLRHTAATWLMQGGVSLWQASGFLGMSPETLSKVYGHHSPDYMREAAEAIGRKRVLNESPKTREQTSTIPVVELVVDRDAGPERDVQRIENSGGPGRTRTCNQTVMSGRL